VFKEQEFLIKIGALTRKQVMQCNKWAFKASFV
jgi:hypothetical protein